MSGRTYTWSKFHSRINTTNVVRIRQRNEFITFTAVIGFVTIIFLCLLELIFQASK